MRRAIRVSRYIPTGSHKPCNTPLLLHTMSRLVLHVVAVFGSIIHTLVCKMGYDFHLKNNCPHELRHFIAKYRFYVVTSDFGSHNPSGSHNVSV